MSSALARSQVVTRVCDWVVTVGEGMLSVVKAGSVRELYAVALGIGVVSGVASVVEVAFDRLVVAVVGYEIVVVIVGI